MYTWPAYFQAEIISRERSYKELAYELLLGKVLGKQKKLSFHYGLGYYLERNTFGRPFAYFYLDKVTYSQTDVRLVELYQKHNLKLFSSLNFEMTEKNSDIQVIIQLPVDVNFIFHRHLQSTGRYEGGNWGFSFNNINLYAGMMLKYKNIGASIQVNIIRFQQFDKVLFNSTLYHYDFDESSAYEFRSNDGFKVNGYYYF